MEARIVNQRSPFHDLNNQVDALKDAYFGVLKNIEYGEIVCIGDLTKQSPRIVGYFDEVPNPLIYVMDGSRIGIELRLQSGTCKELRSHNGYTYYLKDVELSGDEVALFPYSLIIFGKKDVEALLKSEGLSIKEYHKSLVKDYYELF